MIGKLIGVVIGVAIGGVVALALKQPEAQGQEKAKNAQWEFKVVFSTSGPFDNDTRGAENAMTNQYNTLAAEGWEYVGPVVDKNTRAQGPPHNTLTDGAFVLFKRQKR